MFKGAGATSYSCKCALCDIIYFIQSFKVDDKIWHQHRESTRFFWSPWCRATLGEHRAVKLASPKWKASQATPSLAVPVKHDSFVSCSKMTDYRRAGGRRGHAALFQFNPLPLKTATSVSWWVLQRQKVALLTSPCTLAGRLERLCNSSGS